MIFRGLANPLVVAWLICCCTATWASGDDSEMPQPVVCLNGMVRSGFWAGVRLAGVNVNDLRTVDGAGLDVSYPIEQSQDWGYWKVGPANSEAFVIDHAGVASPLPIQILSSHGAGEKGWFVGVGSDLNLSELNSDIVSVGSHDSRASIAITVVRDITAIPDHRLGWDGVDLVILSTKYHQLLASFSERQGQALIDWVRNGGRLLLDIGPEAETAFTDSPWLGEFLANDIRIGTSVTAKPAAIEVFASSRDPLGPLEVFPLPSGGHSLLDGRTNDHKSIRLAAEFACGFGRVTVVGLDLNASPLSKWAGRNRLMRRLLPDLLEDVKSKNYEAEKRILGYDDLAGQVLGAMDSPSRSRAPFSWLVAIVLVYLLLIGPVDYFLINHWIKRSVSGWFTFSVVVAATAFGLIHWSRSQIPDQPQTRKLEVIDFFPEEQMGRAFAWAQLEASSAGQFDIRMVHAGTLTGKPEQNLLTCWQGVAGQTFGGLDAVGAMSGMPPYQLVTKRDSQSISSILSGLPFASGGSRSIVGIWNENDVQMKVGALWQMPGTEAIRGQLINPLQVDLLEPVLIYRSSVYVLPTRFPAGGKINDLERIGPKNFNWRLTRRQLREGASASVPWDPAMSDSLPRIMEVTLFNEVAGGSVYTGLKNRPLRSLDLSYLLTNNRAILVCKIASPATELRSSDNGPYGHIQEELTYCRIVLPVATNISSERSSIP